MLTLLAQTQRGLGGTLKGIGPLGNPTDATCQLFESTISKIIGVLTVSAILWFLLQLFLGAYGWISAGGDAKAVESARQKITNAIIGLIIIFAALILASVIGYLLGVDILGLCVNIQNIGNPGGVDSPFIDPGSGFTQ